MKLSNDQIIRYSRQIVLSEIDDNGQLKLLNSSVFIMGAGGLGSPAAIYLAGAGVGRIGIADFDVVKLSNLHRQILHFTKDVGKPKAVSARDTLKSINPDVEVICYNTRIISENIMDIISDYDIVIDGSDNFPTRFLLNDACFFAGKILISASALGYEGQLTTFKTYSGSPCYRCLYAEPPPPELVPSCQEAGVIGSLAGAIGAMQATEAIKELLNLGKSLAGTLVVYDALTSTIKKMKVIKDPECQLCSENPSVTELIDYDEFCQTRTNV